MRIGVDVVPLLLRSAGVKTWTWHFWQSLRRTTRGDRIIPIPRVPDSPPLLHDRSVLSRLETSWRLAALYASNISGISLIDTLTTDLDVLHISNQIRNVPRRVRITATLHDMTCWLMPECHTDANVKADRRFVRLLLANDARMIAVSESTKRDALRVLDVAPDRIRVIYPGVSEEFFNATAVTRKKPYVLCVGTLEPRKNLVTLLDAWKQLPPAIRSEFDLLVAGSAGWNCEDILTRLRNSSDGIHYLGYSPQQDLPGLMAGATAFVYPSLYEGFGFPVAEAMAARVPVIASNRSSLPEIVGSAGLLIDPLSPHEIRNAIGLLLTSPSLRERCREQGFARARRFTWDESAGQSLRFFHSVA